MSPTDLAYGPDAAQRAALRGEADRRSMHRRDAASTARQRLARTLHSVAGRLDPERTIERRLTSGR